MVGAVSTRRLTGQQSLPTMYKYTDSRTPSHANDHRRDALHDIQHGPKDFPVIITSLDMPQPLHTLQKVKEFKIVKSPLPNEPFHPQFHNLPQIERAQAIQHIHRRWSLGDRVWGP